MTSSTPSPPESSRTTLMGSTFSKSTTASAPFSAAAFRRAPRPTTITRAAPSAFANRTAMSPIGPGPMTTTVPPGVVPASSIPCSEAPPVSTSAPSRNDTAVGSGLTLRIE